jgi:coatomer protein complex subunit alpha (xenin)
MLTHLDRVHAADAPSQPPTSPSLLYTLPALEESLRTMYKAVTEGKFSDALKIATRMLLTIPLTIVDTRKEVDEVKELLVIVKEYHIALRCELKRKEQKEEDVGRSAELAAYFTHCKLEPVHTALSLRSAMTLFFKLKNYASCLTFCRRLLELNPGPKIATQARQVLSVCEKTPEDSVKINYDPRNPFDICSITFTPIYKGSKYVEDPYTGARFQPDCAGQLSPLGDFVKLGADSSGLLISSTQSRN